VTSKKWRIHPTKLPEPRNSFRLRSSRPSGSGPEAEKAVREALDEVENGTVDSLNVDERKISVCYDPTRISREQLTKLVSQAGAKPKEIQTDRAPLL